MSELQNELDKIAELEERLEQKMPWLNNICVVHPEYNITTREEWCLTACNIMKPWLDMAVVAEQEIREIRDKNGVDVVIELLNPPHGFDVAVAPLEKKSRGCLGICRHATKHGDRARIQINPSLTGNEFTNEYGIPHGNDAVYLVHVLLHEMVHAYTEGHGHRGYFSALMKRLNSAGKMTASYPGDMQSHLISTRVLPYLPRYTDLHVPFEVTPRGKRGKGSRLVKLETGCGLVLRASRKVTNRIETSGVMNCPACMYGECYIEVLE
tara:strand:+ start:2312 stop:3112 length:801 start_codon:yes stop_codon:yes gene_type:complete